MNQSNANHPIVHFCTEQWMNDPNGLVKIGDTYHLYFQTNPDGRQWDNIAWGHASSVNLMDWNIHPIALAPYDDIMMFSGSAILDKHNASELGDDTHPPLLAFYTESQYRYDQRGDIQILNQTQCLAYSLDRGFVWQRFAGNPLLDIGCADFRDPKVVEYKDHWVMVVALSLQHKIRFYCSYDLLHWEHISDFDQGGCRLGMWECPDFFPLDYSDGRKWILMMGVSEGGPAQGGATQYIVGDFDGQRFVPDFRSMNGERFLWLDQGSDYFAAQSFSHAYSQDQKRLVMAWHNNWCYANKIDPVRVPCMQSLPRELVLRQTTMGPRIFQAPTQYLESKRSEWPTWQIGHQNVTAGEVLQSQTMSCHWDFVCELSLGDTARMSIRIDFGSEGMVEFRYQADDALFVLDFSQLKTLPAGFQDVQTNNIDTSETGAVDSSCDGRVVS